MFLCSCLSSLQIDSPIYRFLNSIHKDNTPSYNILRLLIVWVYMRVCEWVDEMEWSAHSFANIDADERQSPQMQINIKYSKAITLVHSLAHSRIHSERVVCLLAFVLLIISLSISQFEDFDAHLFSVLQRNTMEKCLQRIVSRRIISVPILNYKRFRILIRYYIKIGMLPFRCCRFDGCLRKFIRN